MSRRDVPRGTQGARSAPTLEEEEAVARAEAAGTMRDLAPALRAIAQDWTGAAAVAEHLVKLLEREPDYSTAFDRALGEGAQRLGETFRNAGTYSAGIGGMANQYSLWMARLGRIRERMARRRDGAA